MFKLTITQKKIGKDPAIWMREVIETIYPETQNQIKLSAEATAEIMRGIILGAYPKATALTNAIQADVIADTAAYLEIGIGKIVDLPKDEQGRDYYNAFNDGWLPPANFGYWDAGKPPIAGTSGGKWTHTGKAKGSFYMLPHKPIEPLKYIDLGYEALKVHIEKEINKFMKSLGNSTRQHGWGMGAGGAK